MAFRNKSKREFKKGMDSSEARRKRGENLVSLRKKTREEQLMKRRMTSEETVATTENPNNENSNVLNVTTINAKLTPEDIALKLQNLPALVASVNSADPQAQLAGVTEFRKLLSIENNPPIQQVIDTGIVPRLVEMLACNTDTKLQFEVAWTLTNIASGTTTHCAHLVKHNAVQGFINLMRSPNADVKEQAVWAIGNIAGDSPKYRDLVIQSGGVPALGSVFTNDAKVSLLRNATWTLSNLCRGKPQPDFSQVGQFLPILQTLMNFEDKEVLTDACWALSYLSDDNTDNNERIQAVIASGVVNRIVNCLKHTEHTVQVPALRTIGNIVTGNDSQTDAVLACEPHAALVALMGHRKKAIRKEACWTISNITAGRSDQIQTIIDSNCIPPMIELLKDEFEVKKEAAWAISNATSGGTAAQMEYIVEKGALSALCNLLEISDTKVIIVALEGIENLLKMKKNQGMEENVWANIVEECGGLELLLNLQNHEDMDVYNKALNILKEFFETEEDDEEETAPAFDFSNNQFAFGDATAGGGFSDTAGFTF